MSKDVRITGLSLTADDGSGFRTILGGRVRVTAAAAGGKPGETGRNAMLDAANILRQCANRIRLDGSINPDFAAPRGPAGGAGRPAAIPTNTIAIGAAAVAAAGVLERDLPAGPTKQAAQEILVEANYLLRAAAAYAGGGAHAAALPAAVAALGVAPGVVNPPVAAAALAAAAATVSAGVPPPVPPAVAPPAAVGGRIGQLFGGYNDVMGARAPAPADENVVANILYDEALRIHNAAEKAGGAADPTHPLRGMSRRDDAPMYGGYRGGAYDEEEDMPPPPPPSNMPPPPPPSARHRKTASGRRNRKRASRKSRV